MLDRIAAFLIDLSRRRVLRVGAVYLVTGWGAIEVADTLVPYLGLPLSVVTAVIFLVALGLPIALALSWAFDLTPEGFRRASPSSAGPSPARAKARPRMRWLPVGAVALVLLPVGWWVWPGAREPQPATDASLVAVLPFRVSGASADMAYLREGVLDLLAATLDGGDELRTVAPGVVTRAAGTASVETIEEASALARSLGAGLLVTGEVVGSAGALIVTARMIDARSGEEIGRARAEQSGEGLHEIIDELAGQLLAIRYGTPEHKLADLTTASLPALRGYLEGRREFRAGNYRAAHRAFDDALELDSTFAQAAFELHRLSAWVYNVETRNRNRSGRLAWQGRDRLNTVDRITLEALLGPRYPRPSSGREQLEAWQRATRISPERPENWFGLADLYYHTGASLGITDWPDRVESHLLTALELDSANVEATQHMFELAVIRGDTAKVAAFADRLVRIDSVGDQARSAQWILLLMGLPGGRDIGLDTLPAERLASLAAQHQAVAVGAHAVGDALEAAEEDDVPLLLTPSFNLAGMRGRVETMRRLNERNQRPGYWTLMFTISVEDQFGDRESLDRALAAWDARPADVPGSAFTIAASRTGGTLSAVHARLARGDVSTVSAAMQEVEEAAADTGNVNRSNLGRLGRYLIAAQHAHAVNAPDVADRLAAVEAYLAPRPGGEPVYQELASLILARIHYERRDYERSLAASRRDAHPRYLFGSLLYLEEGRAAEALGRRDEAIRAYRDFIFWNEHAQGSTRAAVDDARVRLAALLPDT